MKNTISRVSLLAALALTVQTSKAQDIHFTQFKGAPLVINPAFTGNFSGQWRATAIYRDQWRSVTSPFKTYAVSVDAPIVSDLTIDDYLAGGIQLYNDRAGDGNLSNLSALASVAYHKFLGSNQDKVLSVGFQGGYTQKSIDLTRLYFPNEFNNGSFEPGSGVEPMNNKVSYATINAGIAWAHSIGSNFGYTLGVGANNLNQPQESLMKKRNSEVGLGMRYTAQVGAIAYLSETFSLRPAFLYQTQSTATEVVAGNEFHLIVGNPEFRNFTTAVFLGGYYRNSDAVMINAGLEFKGLRVGVSYDYNTSNLKTASNGNGGFEISLIYTAPDPIDFARKLIYPCSRF
ncbi:MAG TPA: PorP/SprF family type IX secretion system membrane protein [Flavipsychrobacter sp.]